MESFKPKRTENEIKKACVEWLNMQPGTFAKVISTTGIPDGKGGLRKNWNKGITDVIGVKQGRGFCMEIKTPEGKAPSPEQVKFMQDFDRAGGYSCVCRSREDCQEAFLEI